MQWPFKEKQGLVLVDRLEGVPGLEVGNHLVSWRHHKLSYEVGEVGGRLKLPHQKGL